MKFEEAVEYIRAERLFQDLKWNRSSSVWDSTRQTKLAVLAEEFGEVARAILENDDINLMEELIDCAATCVAWLESDFS